ncbi:MAG: hypothetical protein QM662_15620, partial [Gordonia sp. (in: high G+C Gram-positive bacteria)]
VVQPASCGLTIRLGNQLSKTHRAPQTSLKQRLTQHARQRWPQIVAINIRYRPEFAYVSADMPDGTNQPLMRLRYAGSASRWGFAVYLTSKEGYEDSVLHTGYTAGSPQDALDTAASTSTTPQHGPDPHPRPTHGQVQLVAVSRG